MAKIWPSLLIQQREVRVSDCWSVCLRETSCMWSLNSLLNQRHNCEWKILIDKSVAEALDSWTSRRKRMTLTTWAGRKTELGTSNNKDNNQTKRERQGESPFTTVRALASDRWSTLRMFCCTWIPDGDEPRGKGRETTNHLCLVMKTITQSRTCRRSSKRTWHLFETFQDLFHCDSQSMFVLLQNCLHLRQSVLLDAGGPWILQAQFSAATIPQCSP